MKETIMFESGEGVILTEPCTYPGVYSLKEHFKPIKILKQTIQKNINRFHLNLSEDADSDDSANNMNYSYFSFSNFIFSKGVF